MTHSQVSLFEPIAVDNFAGGGGASTGIELATGRPVTIAINHDPAAVLLHKTNHPYTQHYCESVWEVDPIKACAGRTVGLAWFSPDCKHFSKAKGAALVDKKIRGLAWIVLRWAGTVRPTVIMLENVEEFVTWGPVRKGKPVRSKAGQTFLKWKSQLEALGYQIEHRELVAADFGAPTTRKRFVLIARCDGRPIVWPERTHAPIGSESVKSGKHKPWVSAASIIDWALPCPSIFDSAKEVKEQYGVKAVRPLAKNTECRISRGLQKFVLESTRPFIITVGYGERTGQSPRIQNIAQPLGTVVSVEKHAVCKPVMTAIGQTGFCDDRSYSIRGPVKTIVTKAEQCIVAPTLIQYHSEQSEYTRGQVVERPLMTVDAAGRYGVSATYLTEYFGNAQNGLDLACPLHTVTTKDREGITAAFLSKFYKSGIGQAIEDPLHTVTTSAGHFGQVTVKLTRPDSSLHHWPKVRKLLNQYCGYHLDEDEILLLSINDVWYYISDIGLRMLTPKELYAAQGFPADYIIAQDYTGKPYPKTQQVARCGNAVCPPVAKALVQANLPEWCVIDISSMEQLKQVIAV